jgi:chemotaxis protein methyltransferase CheR
MASSLPDSVELTEQDLIEIADMLFVMTGIRINNSKRELVRSRLRRRLFETGHETISEYIAAVREQGGEELRRMVEALTTNETRFFREPAHFHWLRERVLREATGTVNIWSAACSTGEEPYSIAMSVLEQRREQPGTSAQVRVLATDIDRQVLEHARHGVYRSQTLASLPESLLRRYFEQLEGEQGPSYRVLESVRSQVSIARLNLMADWPMSGPFDVTFLRNVMIYFDRATRDWLVLRMAHLLRVGGYLLIGHAENLGPAPIGLKSVQPSIYQRTADPLPPVPARPR